jgi:uncharacterized membrane protein
LRIAVWLLGLGAFAAGVVSWALHGGTASIALTVVSVAVLLIKFVCRVRINELEQERERPADAPEDERERLADGSEEVSDPGSWWTGADL